MASEAWNRLQELFERVLAQPALLGFGVGKAQGRVLSPGITWRKTKRSVQHRPVEYLYPEFAAFGQVLPGLLGPSPAFAL